jgi:hypothetical protein
MPQGRGESSAATAHFPVLSFVLTEAALIFEIVCPSSVYIAYLGVIFPMSSSRPETRFITDAEREELRAPYTEAHALADSDV